ncbi:MAG TPA: DUF4388 domain-containing protein, partial [Kofleriaceae bacterium]|nr:DUF4388 domain-containing protein [Kofleriaceae bacterium]
MATLDSKRPAPDGAIVPNAGAVGPQRIAIVSADLERGERLRRGFERSGAEVCLAERASDVAAAMPGADAVVVAHDDRGAILATLAALRAVSKVEAPVLVIGGGDDREAIMGLGVAAWIAGGGEIRDVVTAAALVASQQVRLETVSGIYYLARTLLAQRRTCMVTVSRGLRRGELAFVDGQLSSAAIGMLHGLSAFHQLLLWTRGTLEIRDEDVVPHGEIPLASEDLCDEAKRFLAEVRDAAGSVSPASVYEQCSERAREVLAPAP